METFGSCLRHAHRFFNGQLSITYLSKGETLKKLGMLLCVTALLLIAVACNPGPEAQTAAKADTKLEIPFEKYTLDNGLEVILHQDKSDPIVAMATLVHVGSNRERIGKTGFAHFFEHMSFNDSENVPQGANRKMIEEWGGSRNGGTWNDGTIYFEVVPTDSLEKLMWIDSDRLGYMINTVTEAALENEKQVVKNEKRQRVDNRPYGHTGTVLAQTLYPEGHPYSWPVIGSLEDLQNATLEDVKEFYHQFYGPNNATLVVAGDFEIAEAKDMIQRWFGEIKRGPEVPKLDPMPVTLAETTKVYHLDNFARVPELRITYPTVEMFHKDAYALSALARILSVGKRAPLFRTVVSKHKLAPSADTFASSEELAGTFTIRVRANKGAKLDDVKAAVDEALADFEANGFSDKDLERIKAGQETEFYDGIGSVLNKAFGLARYNTYAGDPGFVSEDVARIAAVTREDIMRAYNTYIKGKHAVITSFVPKAEKDLVLSGSTKADVFEEPIVKGAEKEVVQTTATYEKTPSTFPRTMPEDGPAPKIKSPSIWEASTENGMRLLGVEHQELPMIEFSVTVKGGHYLDPIDKSGVAYLNAQLMNEGTSQRTPEELEDAIGLLGSDISISSGNEYTTLKAVCLARNFQATMDIAAEMLLQPRFDETEFNRLKAAAINRARQSGASPSRISSMAMARLVYGDKHILGHPSSGTEASLADINLEDVKQYYHSNFAVSASSFHVAGAVSQADAEKAAMVFNGNWPSSQVTMPSYDSPKRADSQKIYFVDIPGSKQSVLTAGLPLVDQGPDTHFFTNVAQNRLGSGSSSRLTQLLRIKKGYTYGAYSGVSRTQLGSLFMARTSVRANVTLESLQLLRGEIRNYAPTFTEETLATTKNIIAKRNASRFETLGSLVSLLENMSAYDLPMGTLDNQQKQVANLTLDQVRELVSTQLNEDHMIYLVVGDGQTQIAEVGQLGYGKPVLLDRTGKPLDTGQHE